MVLTAGGTDAVLEFNKEQVKHIALLEEMNKRRF